MRVWDIHQFMKKLVSLKIYGRVQGVFFRDSTQRKAKELNLQSMPG